jgi:hypothetical protein
MRRNVKWPVNKNRLTQLLYCKYTRFVFNNATCFGRMAIIRHIVTKIIQRKVKLYRKMCLMMFVGRNMLHG